MSDILVECQTVTDYIPRMVEPFSVVQEEGPIPKSFSNEEEKQKYMELYNPISESRKRRNHILNKDKTVLQKNTFLKNSINAATELVKVRGTELTANTYFCFY